MGIVSAKNEAVCQELGAAELGFFLTAVKDEQYEFSLHPDPWSVDANLVIAIMNDEDGGSKFAFRLSNGLDEAGEAFFPDEPRIQEIAEAATLGIMKAEGEISQLVYRFLKAPPGQYAVIVPAKRVWD